MRQSAGIVLRIRRDFCFGDVAGGLHERAELAVCHRRAVHPKWYNRYTMNRRFFRVMPIRSHPECATRDRDHVRMTIELRLCLNLRVHSNSFRYEAPVQNFVIGVATLRSRRGVRPRYVLAPCVLNGPRR